MEFEYDEAKLAEMVLYVAGKLRDDRAGGATKLNKVLYFAEFAHVRQHRRPITGAEYRKLEQGPAPRRLRPVRQRLVETADAEIVHDDFLGYEMHRLVPVRPADVAVFSEDELVTIDKVIADLEHLTARQVSDLSHEEAWWPLYDEGDAVPYHAAFMPKRQVITPAARRMAERVAERYGIAADR